MNYSQHNWRKIEGSNPYECDLITVFKTDKRAGLAIFHLVLRVRIELTSPIRAVGFKPTAFTVSPTELVPMVGLEPTTLARTGSKPAM